ncbi:MAG TPA: response regulator [Candidatus Tectomicrobia bacterium]|nr:response regulator [Candidatus Tectomicrobia bacterium]
MAKAQVLIVEDERIVAAELRRRLVRLGYSVSGMAASGKEAIDKAHLLRPDLVLMDVGLIGSMTGIEAGEAIRSRLQIPVVYLTGHAESALPEEVRFYVQKPLDEAALQTTLARALAGPPSVTS